ncbi:MAG TPA: threonine synthase [Bacteroidales bacterium]|nr:threonine synthase [Bacteroidales bacterium]
MDKKQSYYSTNFRSSETSFKEALLKGLAPDSGLYMPVSIPLLSSDELESFSDKEYHEIAFHILNKLIGKEIDKDDLEKICLDAYTFDVPLERVCDRKYIMRLDQGPTASFKDFAARMMSRLMQHYLSVNNRRLTILTATSGDTGSAVASAFYGLSNIDVIILFPANEVTTMQRKQMTTLQKNIKVIAVNGKFDDCQRLVKEAFVDSELSHVPLSSANSINIGRLLPQSVYYFYSWAKLSGKVDDKAIFSVPSGNFGDLMGGLIAGKMGLPVSKFIVATNENDEVPEFLLTGNYKSITPSRNCISSAMNVGHPSNLARIVTLYGGIMDETGRIIKAPDFEKMRKELFAISATDEKTREIIADSHKKYGVLLEPHGAIAWYGINEFFRQNPEFDHKTQLCISLETAHPAKFPEEFRKIINVDPPLPPSLIGLDSKYENYFSLENDYKALKEFILKNN